MFGFRAKRRVPHVGLLLVLAACSENVRRVDSEEATARADAGTAPLEQDAGRSTSPSAGTVRVTFAGRELELTQWQSALSVTQGDSSDVVQLKVGAAASDGSSSANVSVYVPGHSGNVELVGTHAIGDTGPLGIQTTVTLTIAGTDYVSSRGQVQISSYHAGKVRGQLIADLEALEGGAVTRDVTIAFEGKVELVCAVYNSGQSNGDVVTGSTATYARVPLSHPFCEPYTR